MSYLIIPPTQDYNTEMKQIAVGRNRSLAKHVTDVSLPRGIPGYIQRYSVIIIPH